MRSAHTRFSQSSPHCTYLSCVYPLVRALPRSGHSVPDTFPAETLSFAFLPLKGLEKVPSFDGFAISRRQCFHACEGSSRAGVVPVPLV